MPLIILGVRTNHMRVFRLGICVAVTLFAGMAAIAAIQLAERPVLWGRLNVVLDNAVFGGLFYTLVPVIVLAGLTFWRKPPRLQTAALIAVIWLAMIFAWWAEKPIRAYGEFPWWGFKLHFLGMLPVPLSTALAFTVCSRKLLKSNLLLDSDGFASSQLNR